MKVHKCLVPCIGMLLLFTGIVFAQQKYQFQLPQRTEPIYGTWVNTDYDGSTWREAQKWVFKNWGMGGLYQKVSDEKPQFDWTFILVEKWVDSKGATWYKDFHQNPSATHLLLARVSPDGKTLEWVMGYGDFLRESDLEQKSSANWYRIFYRK